MKNKLNKTDKQKQLASNTETTKTEYSLRINKKEFYIKKYPLHYAASQGDLEKVKKILQNKEIEVDARNHNTFTPLHIASGQDYLDIAVELLQHDADPNAQDEEGNTPCHFAAEGNNLKILKCLVKNKYGSKKGDINMTNNYGWSVLHSAASGIVNEKENWDIIEWLLERKANTEVKSGNGFSVRDIFFDKDWSYAEKYDKLVEKFATQLCQLQPNKVNKF